MSDLFDNALRSAKGLLSGSSLLKLFLIFIAYFLTAKGGLELNAVSGFATFVWPPTGIALFALFVFGYRFWPAIFFGAFVVNLFTGATPLIAFFIAIGNTLEPVVGVFLLRRSGFNSNMETARDALLFAFFGSFCNTLISATIGTSSLWLGGVVLLADYPATWLAWWIGDMLGALIVGNLLLNLRKLYLQRKDLRFKVTEIIFFTMTLLIFTGFIFFRPADHTGPMSTMPAMVYLTSPLLIWVALRFGTIGSSLAIFFMSMIAVLGTTMGKGPFAQGELSYNLEILQIFMGSVAVTTMTLAGALAERTRAVTNITKTNDLLQKQTIEFAGRNMRNSWVKKPSGLPVLGELLLILFGFLFITGILLSLNYFGMQTLSSLRAYVGGEGLWSKAQKDAAYQLHVYALSRNEADYKKYLELIAIPLGDKKARIELEKEDADLDYADKSFIEGKNSPEDVRGMSLLFQRFRHVSYMERAIAIWEEGDARIVTLMSLGDLLHEKVLSGVATDEEIIELLRKIDEVNTALTALENDFSFTLGEAARWLTGILILAMFGVATLLIVPGLAISFFVIHNIARLDRAKTEFISLTSHQLRTPPTGIKWYTGMLLDGDVGAINPEQRRYLEQIAYNNQRMIDVVDSVLDISQIELGAFQNNPTQTDICALIDKVIAELDFQLTDKHIALSRRLECGPQPITIDPTLTRIIIQNLLGNAIKYTPRDGEISFAADVSDAKLTVTIADTGLGIPKEDAQNIFEKFYRASNAQDLGYQGTGLGLYVVKRILDQMGGSISFKSELGKGTTFFVSIPMRPKTSGGDKFPH